MWRFKDVESATTAIAALLDRYNAYRAADDFVGMDMARKFLKMGYTRARRYALRRGGRKYYTDGTEILRLPDIPEIPEAGGDLVKLEVACRYKAAWRAVADDPYYRQRKAEHQVRFHAAAQQGE